MGATIVIPPLAQGMYWADRSFSAFADEEVVSIGDRQTFVDAALDSQSQSHEMPRQLSRSDL